MSIVRFGVSLEEEVLKTLDKYVKENQFPNRSQAIRSLVENFIVEKKWESNELVAGAIVMLYDHHKSDFLVKSNNLQHHYTDIILSSQHFHLTHETCLEIIALKGKAYRINELTEKILSLKGIIHGKLLMSKAE